MTDRAAAHRILVPLDGSAFATAALPWVRALATPDTEIVLLSVIAGPLPMIEIAGADTVSYEEIRRERLAATCAWLRDSAASLRPTGAHVSTLATIGHPADEILAVAEERAVDRIVMATRGRGAAGRLMLGSVADRVARAALVPVLLVPPKDEDAPAHDATATVRRLIVPLDGSNRARAALPVASELAGRLGVEIRLVRVMPAREEMFDTIAPVPTAAPARPLTERERRTWEELCTTWTDALETEAQRLRTTATGASAEMLIGQTVPCLLAELATGDLVVMTSHGEGGIRRWQLGSVAEKLLHRATAPVMLVPDPERRSR